MKIKTLIVEDEAVARQVLRDYLSNFCPDVIIIGEAKDAREAVLLILELNPELVLLDVEMPFGNAFDVLEQTAGCVYQTIFITAYSEYAIQALNESAAYYILKPIDIQELTKAVGKVKELLLEENQINQREILLSNLNKIQENKRLVLPTQYGFDVVNAGDVIRLQADGNFTQVHLNNGSKKLVCRFLKHFDSILEKPFLRVHRSHIINLNFVESYQKGNGGTITLTDQSEIEVSAGYKRDLLGSI